MRGFERVALGAAIAIVLTALLFATRGVVDSRRAREIDIRTDSLPSGSDEELVRVEADIADLTRNVGTLTSPGPDTVSSTADRLNQAVRASGSTLEEVLVDRPSAAITVGARGGPEEIARLLSGADAITASAPFAVEHYSLMVGADGAIRVRLALGRRTIPDVKVARSPDQTSIVPVNPRVLSAATRPAGDRDAPAGPGDDRTESVDASTGPPVQGIEWIGTVTSTDGERYVVRFTGENRIELVWYGRPASDEWRVVERSPGRLRLQKGGMIHDAIR